MIRAGPRRASIALPSRRSILTTCLVVAVISYLFSTQIYYSVERIRQTHPFSFQHQVEQTFTPTAEELACLNGDSSGILKASSSSSSSSNKDPIPNVVHFIYGLRNPATHPGAGTFDFLCYLAVRSAIVGLKAEKVYLHYTYLSDPPSADAGADPRSNAWVARLAAQAQVELEHHAPEEFAAGQGHWQAAHASDVLRLQLLQRRGGIYLDIDAFALRPFGPLLAGPRDLVLGHEGGNRWGLCNAVMAARPNSRFVSAWLDRYHGADLSREWNYHSVVLPKEMQLNFSSAAATTAAAAPASTTNDDDGGMLRVDDLCALAPDAFFWPTWTWHHIDWMHARLSAAEARAVSEDIRRNAGSLFEGQLAYHAWNQMAWDRYLKYLTPQKVRNEDTRFNLLMRRFMEDDL